MSTYQPVSLFTSTLQPRPRPAGLVASLFGSLAVGFSVLMLVSAPPPRVVWACVFTTFLPDFCIAILSSCALDCVTPNVATSTNAQSNCMYMVRRFFFIVPSGTKVQFGGTLTKTTYESQSLNHLRAGRITLCAQLHSLRKIFVFSPRSFSCHPEPALGVRDLHFLSYCLWSFRKLVSRAQSRLRLAMHRHLRNRPSGRRHRPRRARPHAR